MLPMTEKIVKMSIQNRTFQSTVNIILHTYIEAMEYFFVIPNESTDMEIKYNIHVKQDK